MASIPEEIIIRYLQQTATEEEKECLQTWLHEDEKHVELFCQLEEIWNSRNTIDETVIRKGWEKLSRSMEPERKETVIPRKSKYPQWIRYAAACVVLFIISSIWITSRDGFPGFGDPVVQNVVFNKNGVELFILPDSSQVWINENSKITYPEKFSKKERLVQLEGKAYFDVRKNTKQPFIVQVNDVEVEVTGTEFFIESTPEKTQIILISGGVQVKRIDNKDKTTLSPGQEATILVASKSIEIKDADTDYYLAWKDGTYRFESEPLGKITRFLARHFELDIQIAESLKEKRFTGRVHPDETIRDVLENISKSIPVRYEITEKTVTISER